MPANSKYAYKSDVGTVRANNEDTAWAGMNTHGQTMVIVCDGLGGHAGGEVASRLTLEVAVKAFNEKDFSRADEKAVRDWFAALIAAARTRISREVATHSHLTGMATTVTGAVANDRTVFVFNCGDSRTYAVRNKAVEQVSIDHNVMNALKNQNAPRDIWERYVGRLNALTSCVGAMNDEEIEQDVFEVDRKNLTAMVACTDGFSSFVDKDVLARVSKASDLEAFVKDMVDMAIAQDSNDNVTVAVMRLDGKK